MSKKHNEHISSLLTNIEVTLGKLDVHICEIKKDIKEISLENKELESKVNALETFKSKTVGASVVIIPAIAFIGAILKDTLLNIL